MPSASGDLASESQSEPADEVAVELVRRVLLGELSAEQACEEYQVSAEQLTEWMRIHRRAVRRAIDDQIAASLTAQGLEREDFVISGNLESMSLSDLLETIQLGRKHAYIRIDHDGQQGFLWCANGDVIDARIGTEVGSPAVYQLLSLKEGRIKANFSPVEHERSILASTQELLMEHARRCDELERLRGQLGDRTRTLWQNQGESAGQTLAPRELATLQAFEGGRSMGDVVTLLKRPELETLMAIARLLEVRALVSVPPPPVVPEPPVVQRAAQPGYASLPPASRGPVSSGASVPPIAPSVVSRRSLPALTRRYGLWALAGSSLLIAFAAGLWTAPGSAPAPQPAAAAPGSSDALESALCGSGMKLFSSASIPGWASAARASVAPFCLAGEAVSADEYRACTDSKHCDAVQSESDRGTDSPDSAQGLRCNFGVSGHGQYPINCVTQRQAEQYCEWRGQRLPLPDEWELAWQTLRPQAAPTPGSSRASSRRIGDLSEWTKDRADRPQRGAAPAEQQLYAVMRVDTSLEPAPKEAPPSRLYVVANAHARGIGFRCALSLQAAPAR